MSIKHNDMEPWPDHILYGLQLYWMICPHFRADASSSGVYYIRDTSAMRYPGDSEMAIFRVQWDEVGR